MAKLQSALAYVMPLTYPAVREFSKFFDPLLRG